MVAKTLETLVAAQSKRDRTAALNKLGHQLSAHSLAEENVIYPMLESSGVGGSDKLYMDQAHAKVMNAQLATWAALDKGGQEFTETARKLQAAVLQHAKQDEEGNLYPKLKAKLSAQENKLATSNYKAQFDSVKAVKVA